MRAAIRDYRPEDLARVLDLWQRSGLLPVGADGLTLDQAVDLMSSAPAVTLVAELEGDVVGVAIGTAASVVGWIYRVTIAPELGDAQVIDQLLERLEGALAERGARKLSTVVAVRDAIVEQLEGRGFRLVERLRYLERLIPATVPVRAALVEVGGRMIDPGLWGELKGLEHWKEIIERRVILPLAEPDLAIRHALSPPRAIVLFGPPGTGKTTFAKGIASRLAWPFVEIQPAELAGEGAEREAGLLAEAFDRVRELSSAVVFVDEVEDLASIRHEQRRASPSVTNEFLKQIPRIREAPEHLLVCATNWVRRLDPAFLRPGRFDYVLPVGPPDREAREAIWRRYVGEITDQPVDLDRLVEASDLFTPADIEFAARKAAQRAFEREHFDQVQGRAVTEDFLAAIAETRPSLSTEVVESFQEDTRNFARY
jgi:MoxR-like ATPase/N-acetylglutamate synthase-like GNAT family acetyltransferase